MYKTLAAYDVIEKIISILVKKIDFCRCRHSW